ncbi:MAG: tyrosine-type recombinase/integrase [Hydrogenibacillus sp.]|nr:tyrosine-type recombinase/integrase [Hydrogenibacillus sp.]
MPGKKRSSPEWQQVLEEYLLYRKADGLREKTLASQREIIFILFRRYPEAWNEPKQAVLKFLSEEVNPATYNLRLSYLKTFFNWCIEQGLMHDNPVKGFKKRKADHRIVQLDETIISRLLELPNKRSYAGLRDYALLLLTLDTGIRPKEAFALQKDDVNLRSNEVYVRANASKTKISRTLPISPITAKAIRQLLSARHPDWKDDVPVFASADGTPLNKDTRGDRLEMLVMRLTVYATVNALHEHRLDLAPSVR